MLSPKLTIIFHVNNRCEQARRGPSNAARPSKRWASDAPVQPLPTISRHRTGFKIRAGPAGMDDSFSFTQIRCFFLQFLSVGRLEGVFEILPPFSFRKSSRFMVDGVYVLRCCTIQQPSVFIITTILSKRRMRQAQLILNGPGAGVWLSR